MQENLHILSADVLALMGAWAYADRVVFKDMSYLSEPPLIFSPRFPLLLRSLLLAVVATVSPLVARGYGGQTLGPRARACVCVHHVSMAGVISYMGSDDLIES